MPSLNKLAASATFAAAMICLSAAAPANADVVWVLSDVPLSDGGVLDGSFSIDQYGFFDAFDLTTTGGTNPSYHYGLGHDRIILDGKTLTVFSQYPDGVGALNLQFERALTYSGVDPITGGIGGPSFECDTYESGSYACPGVGPARFVAEGFAATAAPEPMTWALMLVGFLGLGAMVRRSRGVARTVAV